MNKNYRKKFVVGILILFIGTTVIPIATMADTSHRTSSIIESVQKFSKPIIKEEDQYLKIDVKESNSLISDPTRPMLPVFTKKFEFPWGTKINNISVAPSNIQSMSISKKVKPASVFNLVGNEILTIDGILDVDIYSKSDPYPSEWYHITKGTGINKNGNHVLIVSVNMYPARYRPLDNIIQYVEKIYITIDYKEPVITPSPLYITYDLVIISPSEFIDYLAPLVTHKNNHGVKTNLVTLDYIYSNFTGRDHAEQIKYFIKYALDEWNIRYVLLVGDITRVPIRTSYGGPSWGGEEGILSDLYYADIYDENYSFCSWDANNNSRFGEVDYGTGFSIPYEVDNLDGVDLYPDVSVGRLACTNIEEVQTLVDKIITYEDYTYDQLWFKKIVLAGGDTFPPGMGAPPFVYEGEITNEKVAQQLPDFRQIRLWSSRHNLNAITFNRKITQGAGFVSYAGHGFEHGWGTYRPNFPGTKMGFIQPLYYTPFINFLRNGYKLPIIFFDACLTAKLDFNISDLDQYYHQAIELLLAFTNMHYDTSYYFPCFAWSFLSKENGGAIAAIGSTRSAYTYVDKDGVYAGAGYLDVHFFKAYSEGVSVSQMFTQSQNDYINNVGKDYFTLEEFILLGDPSLIVGGYP